MAKKRKISKDRQRKLDRVHWRDCPDRNTWSLCFECTEVIRRGLIDLNTSNDVW